MVGCMDRTRLRNEIETKIYIFILEIVKIRRSPYADFNFTNLRINTDVLSPMLGDVMGNTAEAFPPVPHQLCLALLLSGPRGHHIYSAPFCTQPPHPDRFAVTASFHFHCPCPCPIPVATTSTASHFTHSHLIQPALA